MGTPTLPPDFSAQHFSIGAFLDQERGKDLFRFSTAGSVDDGKSTLIGRLLYDTDSVYDDQVQSIQGKGTTAPGEIDFALLTDGLRAEREQGITIDVAYRYFSTANRKFIIADTPGHEQYTRNMATGSSTADATVVLIDARKGVLPQSLRHAYIASLLGVRHIIVAVNKMDLVAYDEAVFRLIERDFRALLDRIAADTGSHVSPVFVPVSALAGDNVVYSSTATPWYRGASLLELLETLPSSIDVSAAPFRFSVQRVLRPDAGFRGFAGQIASGTIRPGDPIAVLPSGREATVSRIVTYDGDLDQAYAPLSVTLVLDTEVDISRGDLIASVKSPATVTSHCRAALVWMDQVPLELNRRYLLKHTSQTIPVVVTGLDHRIDSSTITRQPATTLEMNGIGVVTLQLLRPVAIDRYPENRSTGALILIDPVSNATVAAGMITDTAVADAAPLQGEGPVTAEERAGRWGHRGALIELTGPGRFIDEIERAFLHAGLVTFRAANLEQAEWLLSGGVLAIIATPEEGSAVTIRVAGQEQTVSPADRVASTTATLQQLLSQSGILLSTEGRKIR